MMQRAPAFLRPKPEASSHVIAISGDGQVLMDLHTGGTHMELIPMSMTVFTESDERAQAKGERQVPHRVVPAAPLADRGLLVAQVEDPGLETPLHQGCDQ